MRLHQQHQTPADHDRGRLAIPGTLIDSLWREPDVRRTVGVSQCHTRTLANARFKPLDAADLFAKMVTIQDRPKSRFHAGRRAMFVTNALARLTMCAGLMVLANAFPSQVLLSRP
jgi:hypothetical protein